MSGIIQCDDASAAVTILESCRGADWIQLSYPRSKTSSTPNTTSDLTRKIKMQVDVGTTESASPIPPSPEGEGAPLMYDDNSVHISRKLRGTKWARDPPHLKVAHWNRLETAVSNTEARSGVVVNRNELVWEDLPDLDAD